MIHPEEPAAPAATAASDNSRKLLPASTRIYLSLIHI